MATKSRLRTVRKPSFRVIVQKAFNVLFQIVVSYKAKEAKNQRLRKNIFTKLSSFFSCFREIIHSFIFDQTCNGAKHVERYPNWKAWTSLKGGTNVSHNYLNR